MNKHTEPRARRLAAGASLAAIALVGSSFISAKASDSGEFPASGMTVRPELESALIVSTTTRAEATATNPSGTRIAYTFDEPIAFVLDVAKFKVYTSLGKVTTGGMASISDDSRTVTVLFHTIDSEEAAASLTRATVALGAVSDADLWHNPEGDAEIGEQRALSPGSTTAPDLQSITFQGAEPDGSADVDFTFDEGAFVHAADGFHLVATDGRVARCTSTSGDGETTVRVRCEPYPATSALAEEPATDANTARAYVVSRAVCRAASGETNGCNPPEASGCNPLQASDVPNAPTSAPDLVSAKFKPATDSTSPDTVEFAFDQSVQALLGPRPDGSRFRVYFAATGGEQTGGTGASGTCAPVSPQACPAPTVSGGVVTVSFPSGTLANAVGVSVAAGAVTAAAAPAGIRATTANLPDEVAATIPSPSSTPGRTAGPHVVSVVILAPQEGGLVPIENSGGYSVIFNFDQAIAQPGQPGAPDPKKFHLYLADGTQLVCNTPLMITKATSSSFSDEVTDNQAICIGPFWVFGPSGESGSHTPGNLGPEPQELVGAAVIGSVAAGAVTSATTGVANPEDVERTIGSSGTPTN